MKQWAYAAWCNYFNSCANNTTGNTPEVQDAFHVVLKKAIKKVQFPRDENELGIIDTVNDFDLSPLARQIPGLVTGFMHDEDRAFELPAVDGKTAPGSLRIAEIPEKTREGVIMLGDRKGETYTSTTGEHNEYKVKSNTDAFRK